MVTGILDLTYRSRDTAHSMNFAIKISNAQQQFDMIFVVFHRVVVNIVYIKCSFLYTASFKRRPPLA